MPASITPLAPIGTPGTRLFAQAGYSGPLARARDLPGVFLTRAHESALYVVRVERDGTEHEVVTVARRPSERCCDLEVSADGRFLWVALVSSSDPRGHVFRDGQPVTLAFPEGYGDLPGTWLGGGARLCVNGRDETRVFDANAGALLASFTNAARVIASDEGGHLLVEPWSGGTLSVYPLDALERPATTEMPARGLFAICPAGTVVWGLWELNRDRRISVVGWEHARDRKHQIDFEPGRGHGCRHVLYPGPAPLTAHVECSCGDGARLTWEPSTGRVSLHRYHRPREGTPADFHPPVPSDRDSAFDFPDGAVGVLALSPDERSVAFGRADGTARIARLEDGAVLWDLEGHRGAIECCVWSRDGAMLYTVSDDRTLRGWDVARGAEHFCAEMPQGMKGYDRTCVLSEDGDTLAFAVGPEVFAYDFARSRWGESFDVDGYSFLRALRVGERGVQCQRQSDDVSNIDCQAIVWIDPARREVGEEVGGSELAELCAQGKLFPAGDRAVVLARELEARPDGGYDDDEDDDDDDEYREAVGAVVDLDTGELLRLAPRGSAFDDVAVVCAAVGERWVAAGYASEPRVTLWDARTGALLPPIELPTFEHATAIVVCEARSEVLVGTNGGRVLRYRLDPG